MQKIRSIIFFIALLSLTHLAIAQEDLAENLKVFKPHLGKTWKGEFKNSTKEKPVFDVSRWERALNGQAVRVQHSINNGDYGGESIIFWDNEKKSLVFYYFTTAGFFTTGTMTVENGKFISHEYVKGYQNNSVTEVKAAIEFTADGKMINKSQYLKNGEWVDGHEAIYVEDAAAQVVFK
jgi:hypothetical protein